MDSPEQIFRAEAVASMQSHWCGVRVPSDARFGAYSLAFGVATIAFLSLVLCLGNYRPEFTVEAVRLRTPQVDATQGHDADTTHPIFAIFSVPVALSPRVMLGQDVMLDAGETTPSVAGVLTRIDCRKNSNRLTPQTACEIHASFDRLSAVSLQAGQPLRATIIFWPRRSYLGILFARLAQMRGAA